MDGEEKETMDCKINSSHQQEVVPFSPIKVSACVLCIFYRIMHCLLQCNWRVGRSNELQGMRMAKERKSSSQLESLVR